MKTSELIGNALDWAVDTAEFGKREAAFALDHSYARRSCSANWAQGGPIIEREKIELYFAEVAGQWAALIPGKQRRLLGPTPLIAAMRCYVASKLGDEIDIPEELL
jgi:hypothetical protein